MTADREPLARRLAWAKERLRRAGIAAGEADMDARLLAQEALGWDAARLLASASEPAPPAFAARYDPLVSRREAREPMAYIVGRQEFWDLTLKVTPAVLIPRPESELVVEAALELLGDAPARVADVCTGSGCLALAVAQERRQVTVVATDLSAEALAVARHNTMLHDLDARVALVRTDLLAGVAGPFDLVISNPPYVPQRDRPALPAEVGKYEPALALFGGDDGLAIIRRLLDAAGSCLKPGGTLVFEFGFAQDEAVAGLIDAASSLTMVAIRSDLQGIPRTAVARRVERA